MNKTLFFYIIFYSNLFVNAQQLAGYRENRSKSVDYQHEVSLNAVELIDMPAENRLEIAQNQKSVYRKKLVDLAFSKDQDYSYRWKSLTLLAQIEKDKAIPHLQRALKSPDWFMRNAALLAYSNVLPSQAHGIALDLISDKALVVRSSAVDVLSSRPMDLKTRDKLWQQLNFSSNFRKNKSLFIRKQIVTALAAQPEKNEKEQFESILQENDPELTKPARAALLKIQR